jgi:hypothetical protein
MQFSSTVWQKPVITHTSVVIHLGFSDWSLMRAFSLHLQLASMNNLMLSILISGSLPKSIYSMLCIATTDFTSLPESTQFSELFMPFSTTALLLPLLAKLQNSSKMIANPHCITSLNMLIFFPMYFTS